MNGIILDANKIASKRLGYTEREFLKMTVKDIDTPDEFHMVSKRIEELCERGHVFFETAHMTKTGNIISVDVSSRIIDYNGKPAVMSIARDITERKRIEEEQERISRSLQKSEATMKSLLQAAPIVIGFVRNRILGWINDEITRMVGYSPEELSGKSARILYETEEEFFRVGKVEYGRIVEGGARAIETIWQHKDGRILDVFLSSSFIEPGNISAGLVFTAMDITDRKRGEEILRNSENKYRTLFSSMNEGAVLHEIIYDREGNPQDYIIIEVNPAFELITGLKKEDVIGKKATEIYKDTPYLDIYSETARSSRARLFEIYYPPMEKYFKISVYSPGKGKFATIFTDITSQKMADEAIKKLNSELLEKNEELQQIIYVASHDLRSPLLNIQGFGKELENSIKYINKVLEEEEDINSVRKRLDTVLKEDILLFLTYILTSTNKMHSLLSGLLKLSRLGRGAVNFKVLDMNELIEEILKTFEFKIKETEVILEVGNLPPCRGDEIMINQVFSNLIDNALKFLAPESPGIIRIFGYEKCKVSTYCVEDNGVGISSVYKEKIFEIFHKLDSSRAGEGLGLTIIRKILDRHNGKIWLESEPDKGSKFFVSLLSE